MAARRRKRRATLTSASTRSATLRARTQRPAVTAANVNDGTQLLDLIDAILDRGELGEYHLAHAARAARQEVRLERHHDARLLEARVVPLLVVPPEVDRGDALALRLALDLRDARVIVRMERADPDLHPAAPA